MMKRSILCCAMGLFGWTAVAALPDPVVYFSFDEAHDGVVADLSGNGRNLTLGAGCAITNDSAAGSALWFEGLQSTYAQFAAPSLPKRTISFWYKRDLQPGAYFEEYGATDNNPRMPMLICELSKFYVRFGNGWAKNDEHARGIGNFDLIGFYGTGGALGAVYFSYLKYPQLYPEQWTHVVYAIEVTNSVPTGVGNDHEDVFNMRLYVNGDLYFAQDGGVTTNSFPASTATLGNNGVNGKRPCRGTLDEFKVFDQYLTQEQVREEYDRCKDTANRFRLVAWYPFQEFSDPDGSGNYTTPDMSPWGRANNRTMDCSSETSVVAGPNGTDKAIHFQGTSMTHAYARVPFAVDAFTMSAWVNCSTNTSILRIASQTANYPRLINYGSFCSYYHYSISSLQNQYTMPGDGTIRTFANTAFASKGDWQHIVWVVRNVRTSTDTVANTFNQVHEYYINGELANTGVEVKGAASGMDTLLILGSTSTGSSVRIFEGDVSDFRLYGGAMSAEDVKKLYRGAAQVNAGADVTVKGAQAVLVGTVGAAAATPTSYGYAGDVSWSLVSAPAGVEQVDFLRPHNPVTEVTLPVEGAYVFQLATRGFCGDESRDTVTVTRNDATGAPSTVPVVDVAAVAAEEPLRASLATGLIRHWTANGLSRVEKVTNTRGMNGTDWSQVGITNGVTGGGFFSRANVPFGGVLNTEISCGEKAGPYGGGYEPTNEWLTVSAWIRPDSQYPADWYAGAIVHMPLTLSICYGQWYQPHLVTTALPGFCIQQTGILGHQAYLNYSLPAGTTMSGLCDTWQHVVALVNRHQTALSEFYLNGVKLAEDTTRRSCQNYGTYTADKGNAVYFSGKPCGGRQNGEAVRLLNTQNERGGENNIIFVASNTTTHVVRSRHFPGAIDEIRFYNRKLTAEEIAFLHAHPDLDANAAPVVAKAVAPTQMIKKTAKDISALAADDGNVSTTLTYEWGVAKGDPSQVVFENPGLPATKVTVKAKGSYAFLMKVSDGERATDGEPVEVEVENAGLVIFLR